MIDGFLAEYYYLWSEQLGIEEAKVSKFFLEAGV